MRNNADAACECDLDMDIDIDRIAMRIAIARNVCARVEGSCK